MLGNRVKSLLYTENLRHNTLLTWVLPLSISDRCHSISAEREAPAYARFRADHTLMRLLLLLLLCAACVVLCRCMQLMQLQRQHRRLVQEHYLAYHQQQQQQGESSDTQASNSSSSSSSSGSKVPPVTPEELAEVDIWDAFFDADLADYAQYLRAARDGLPSVFTTINPNSPSGIQQQQQQQQGLSRQAGSTRAAPNHSSGDDEDSSSSADHTSQEQQQQQLVEARQQLANSAAMLDITPPGILSRPLLLLGGSQLLQLAVMADGRVEDVVEVLQDFYKLKRLGFRAALQELMEVADEQSVVERF
jgi:cell division protein FtsL